MWENVGSRSYRSFISECVSYFHATVRVRVRMHVLEKHYEALAMFFSVERRDVSEGGIQPHTCASSYLWCLPRSLRLLIPAAEAENRLLSCLASDHCLVVFAQIKMCILHRFLISRLQNYAGNDPQHINLQQSSQELQRVEFLCDSPRSFETRFDARFEYSTLQSPPLPA